MTAPVRMVHDLDGRYKRELPVGWRRIAWNGVSFGIPANWELAVYEFPRRDLSRIELEDECSARMEAEWMQGQSQRRLVHAMERYAKTTKSLTLKSVDRVDVEGLPSTWNATRFILRESGVDARSGGLAVSGHELVTAFYRCPRQSMFCFLVLHFAPDDPEKPDETTQRIAATFQDHHAERAVPWQLFDIAFATPPEFRLEKATFDIGNKRMVFKWHGRRFYLWHFSCVDMFLKENVTPAEWSAAYLNRFGGLPGPLFEADGKGGIKWRRRRPHVFGHRSEIAHWCFRYAIGCYRLEARSQLVVWVFHHRHPDDPRILPLE